MPQPLHLDHDFFAVDEAGEVHLRQGGGGLGLGREPGVDLLDAAA